MITCLCAGSVVEASACLALSASVTCRFAGPCGLVWRDVEVEGGTDRILAGRPIKMKANPQGYVYDLWLVERLADRLGA
jgi:hypothetical protein